MSSRTVRVVLTERSYEIEIGQGNLAEVARFITARGRVTHAVIVADSHTAPLYGKQVLAALQAAGVRADLLEIPAGEESKNAQQLFTLWNALLELKADRKTVIVAVGGGVIGDLGGFLAASYARGLTFYQVPTTLLADVDSSVGGKTGINLPQSKNMVGAFWQPAGVLIDIAALDTLPSREYLSGLAEVVKYGVILDEPFFGYLEQNVAALVSRDAEVVKTIIQRSCELKADVVRQDEREETGLRAVLNYGHTFCHAIEAVAGYGRYLHGEAVSMGMVCASRLAERLGRVPAEMTIRQEQLLLQLGLPTEVGDLPLEELLAAMQRDKKVEHGKLRFVLPSRLGHVELVGDISPLDAEAAMKGK